MKRLLLAALLFLIASPVCAASRFWVPLTVTGAVSGTGGLCRLTVNDTTNLSAGITVIVAGILGATACDGTTTVTTVVDATHVEVNLSFNLAYTSGGTVAGGIWTATGTGNWSASSGGAGGQSVPGSSDTVTLDGSSGGGTVIPNTTITVVSIAMGAFTGTLDFSVNNNSVTMTGVTAGLSVSGSGTRTMKMGNGTWTINCSGSPSNPFDAQTKTNLTFIANSSSFVINSTSSTSASTLNFNSLTFYDMTFNGNSNSGPLSITGSNIFHNLTINGLNYIWFIASGTQTVTSLTLTGASATAPVFLTSASTTINTTISQASGTPSMTYVALRNITMSGGATFNATNSFNLGQNSGVIITGPATASGCIIGGWLLRRDFNPAVNDNRPAFMEQVA